MADPVLLNVSDFVATLTLNQPEQRNAMRPELLEDFAAKVAELKERDDARVVVVQGSGKIFCSGADFRAMTGMAKDAGGMEEAVRRIYGSFLCLRDLPQPTIAKVNGHAIGGGLGLALACDLRVVSTAAKLGVNFTRLGFTPGMATTYVLPRLVGMQKAAELFFTGRIFSGEEAEKLGIANYAVAPEELDAKADALAREIADSAPLAVALTKQALYRACDFDANAALAFEAQCQAKTMKTKDAQEGILAMMQKRDPKFSGK